MTIHRPWGDPGKLLRTVRDFLGHPDRTARELARNAGVSEYQLSRWLNGHVSPSFESRFRLWTAMENAEEDE